MKLTCLLLVELKLEYAMISSSLPSSAAPSILIKPGFESYTALPPITSWNNDITESVIAT